MCIYFGFVHICSNCVNLHLTFVFYEKRTNHFVVTRAQLQFPNWDALYGSNFVNNFHLKKYIEENKHI